MKCRKGWLEGCLGGGEVGFGVEDVEAGRARDLQRAVRTDGNGGVGDGGRGDGGYIFFVFLPSGGGLAAGLGLSSASAAASAMNAEGRAYVLKGWTAGDWVAFQ